MELKSALIIIHLLGLALGVGAATLLDLLIMKFMIFGRISTQHLEIVNVASQVVAGGLALLWISGLGFLAYYYFFVPENLPNQKIYAKMAIVLALTINGHMIHHHVLPLLRENLGRRLFSGVTNKQRMVMLTAGAVSATSWYIPLALGVMRELNFSSGLNILIVYVVLLIGAISVAQIAGYLIANPRDLQRVRLGGRMTT